MQNIDKVINYTKELKLLFIEDEKDVRDMTLFFFEDLFDDIIIAKDGNDGLEKFRNNKIDIVITDINMKNMCGLELIKNIKKIDDKVPIFIFSAFTEAKYTDVATKLGVNGYLHKPLDSEIFLKQLSSLIEV